MVARQLNRGNATAIEAAVAAAGLRPGQTAADIGFGGGYGLRLLLDRVGPGGHVHGIELSDTMLEAAGRRQRRDVAAGRLSLTKGTLEHLPFADGEVDALISVNTLYFVADLAPAFAELARVLAPGGRAVLGVADPDWMATMAVTAHVFRLRPVAELVAGLASAGLAVREEKLDDRREFRLLVASHGPIEGPE